MEITQIYGEAQLDRALENDHLNVVIYTTKGCSKSTHLRKLVKEVTGEAIMRGVNILLVDNKQLPETFYKRRAITRFPSVCYCIGKLEHTRMTGMHTRDMFIRGVTRAKERLTA